MSAEQAWSQLSFNVFQVYCYISIHYVYMFSIYIVYVDLMVP